MKKYIAIFFLVFGTSGYIQSQPTPPGGGGTPPGGGEPAPITGIELLIGGGVIWGARKIYLKRGVVKNK